jgi:tetratricopeptide (TPR) repeat protein
MLAGAVLAAALTGIVLAQTYDAGTELALIERVQKARSDYQTALTELYNFYLSSGDMASAKRAERELGYYRSIEKYDYSQKSGEITQPVTVLKYVPEAEDYYNDAVIFADSTRKARKDLALARFKTILERWPESARAPEAAFQVGEILSGMYYKDYDKAADFYKKAYDLNPAITQPALVKAGDMYYKVERYDDAVAMYKLAVEGSRDPEAKAKAEKMLQRLSEMGH